MIGLFKESIRMYKKKILILALFLTLILPASQLAQIAHEKSHKLYFKETKNGGWSLREDFLNELAMMFHHDVFIESGTSYGNTVKNAKNIFNEVYSIECDENLYQRAQQQFSNDSNVHLYHGDSGKKIGEILSSVQGKKLMFWLDGHYSGFGQKPESNTPIIQELIAIKNSDINDAVILIDDICCYKPTTKNIPEIAQGYPSVDELRELLYDINPAYEIMIYGDIAIVYPAQYGIEISPLIKAMTTSRFFDKCSMSYNEVFEAESIIATKTTPQELEALWGLCSYHFGWHRTYPYLWYSLALCGHDRWGEAYDNLNNVLETGYDDWRIYWYIAQAAYRSAKNFEPYMTELFRRSVDTKQAEIFLKHLNMPV
jgi:hypothetical protein